MSDDSDVSLLILVVFTIESDDVFLCPAVIMPQITKMIITQYMNIMRICLLEKRDILIPRIMPVSYTHLDVYKRQPSRSYRWWDGWR